MLADGELLITRKFEDVNRDTITRARVEVIETAGMVLSDAEIQALRKVVAAKDVVVRLTGTKGYTTLKKDAVKLFREDAASQLAIYDKLNLTLANYSGSPCE